MTSSLTISIEIELGWGVHDLPQQEHLSADGATERKYLQKLLRKTEKCKIPISFDIVGHLLLEECDGTHDGPYRDDWFAADPATGVETDPLFYAPDMARQISNTDTEHELCTHTFSHLLCTEATDDLIELELQHAQELHEDVDEPFSSFVPPRHQEPDNDVLHRNDVRIVRYSRRLGSPTPAHRFKELTVGPHPEWEPRMSERILETYCTEYPSLTARSLPGGQRESSHPVFTVFPLEAKKRTHQYYLRRSTRRAIESGTPLHLWCHLYDLSNELQWEILSDYFEYLSEIPGEKLRIKTMRELSDEYLRTPLKQ